MSEVALHPRRGERVVPQQQHVIELHVLELVAALGEGPHEGLRDGGVPTVVHAVAALDHLNGLSRAAALGPVVVQPVHDDAPCANTVASGAAATPRALASCGLTGSPRYR